MSLDDQMRADARERWNDVRKQHSEICKLYAADKVDRDTYSASWRIYYTEKKIFLQTKAKIRGDIPWE